MARLLHVGNNYNNGLNANNNLNNNGQFLGMTRTAKTIFMQEDNKLWIELCSYNNLELAFLKARKRKTKKLYVKKFEKNLIQNLLDLKEELLLQTYSPSPLTTFILRDPKTRKISKSEFRDRIIHHALVNLLEPIFEKSFIYDSYANRKGKGTSKALQRFEYFKRQVSMNNTAPCFILKEDIKHYFEEVDHEVLLKIIQKKIKDKNVICLIKRILVNGAGRSGGGANDQRHAPWKSDLTVFC